MQNYKVWLRARDPKTLEVVASVRVYNHEDRLAAEKVLETAQTRLQMLVLQLLHVHPGAVVSTEMEHQLHDEHVTTVQAESPVARTFMGLPSPLRAVHDDAAEDCRAFWVDGRCALRVSRYSLGDSRYMAALLARNPSIRYYPNAGAWSSGQVVGNPEAMGIAQRQEGMPKAMAAQYGVPMLWSHDPEKAMAEMQHAAQDALRFRKLHSHLCGYIENGGGESVTIYQDDATRDWSVRVGPAGGLCYHGGTLREAFDLATEQQGDKS